MPAHLSLKLNYAHLHNACCLLSICLSVCPSVNPCLFTYKLLQNHLVKFHHTWHKAFRGEDDWLKFVQMKGHALSLSKGDNSYIVKIHSDNLFSRTTGPISTKLGTVDFDLRRLSFFQMEFLALFLRGYYSSKLKIYGKLLKISSRTAGPISIKQDTKYSWVKEIKICLI